MFSVLLYTSGFFRSIKQVFCKIVKEAEKEYNKNKQKTNKQHKYKIVSSQTDGSKSIQLILQPKCKHNCTLNITIIKKFFSQNSFSSIFLTKS